MYYTFYFVPVLVLLYLHCICIVSRLGVGYNVSQCIHRHHPLYLPSRRRIHLLHGPSEDLLHGGMVQDPTMVRRAVARDLVSVVSDLKSGRNGAPLRYRRPSWPYRSPAPGARSLVKAGGSSRLRRCARGSCSRWPQGCHARSPTTCW